MKNLSLYKQLAINIIIIFFVILISLGFFLPRVLLPIYEKNIYKYLKQPLYLVNNDVNDQNLETEVAYLYFRSDNKFILSENFNKVISLKPEKVLEKIETNSYGKFRFNGKIYYYNTFIIDGGLTLSITDDSYIIQIKKDILHTIFPVIFISLIIIMILIFLWSRKLIIKIKYLKEKVDNLDNENYIDKGKISTNDELRILSDAIDNMKLTLQKQEEYKNQMYQNISHDFKTPIAVIKSYIEAYEDGIETDEEIYKVIKEEVYKLENKVHSLLYLNKLSYISNLENIQNKDVDISITLNELIKKFKIQRPDIKFKIYLNGSTIFRGSQNLWEAIIENLLNNFIRYAKTCIKITIKDNQIIFYNDGPNVNDKIFDDLFTPYKKGINGQFGLGLSIVKKSLMLCGYEINVKNEKKGVSFIIKLKK